MEGYSSFYFYFLIFFLIYFKGRNGVHYVGVSVSFIDNWKLWAVALSVKRITKAHTAINIKDEVVKVLDFYGIVPQCYVADNASNQVILVLSSVMFILIC